MKSFVMKRFSKLSVVVLATLTAFLLMPTLPVVEDVNASGGKSQTYAQEIVLKPNSAGTRATAVMHGTTRLWKDEYVAEYDYFKFRTSGYRGSTYHVVVTHDGGTSEELRAYLYDEDGDFENHDWCIYPYNSTTLKSFDSSYVPKVNTVFYTKVACDEGDNNQADYTINITEKIRKPQKQTLSSSKAGKKKITLKYTRDGYSERYQVAYKIQKGKKWIYKTTKNNSYVIKKLKAKKKYKVKVRGQRKCYGKWVSGNWSKTKTVKVK